MGTRSRCREKVAAQYRRWEAVLAIDERWENPGLGDQGDQVIRVGLFG